MTDYPKIEELVEDLTSDLAKRDFVSVNPVGRESLRYKKRGSPYQFQVGIDERGDDKEEPDFNHIYLYLDFKLPNGLEEPSIRKLAPPEDLRYAFFRNSKIFHHFLIPNEKKVQKYKVEIIYHIGFEKDKTSHNEMRNVLRESIDYFCDYITVNINMLKRTQSLG